jgi:hypothetical protein
VSAALGGTGAQNNLGAVIVLMNRSVNAHIGSESNERRNQDTEALERRIQHQQTRTSVTRKPKFGRGPAKWLSAELFRAR